MHIYKTKLYKVDYKGTHGGGVDVYRGSIILNKYRYLIDEYNAGNIVITRVNG